MDLRKPSSRRHFTDAARAAAAEARRRKREAGIPRETPAVYVVRMPDAPLWFGWEIRRFGAEVLDRSRTGFPTVQDARAGGAEDLTPGTHAKALRQEGKLKGWLGS